MGEAVFYTAGLGAYFDVDFCGQGRIKVVRKGRCRAHYVLKLNGNELAEMVWRGPRRIRYTTFEDRAHFDMRIGPMKRKIRGVDGNGKLGRLIIPSNKDLGRRDLRAQMYNGDNFIVHRHHVNRWGAGRFEIRKQHYPNNVLIFHFNHNDPEAPILIDIEKLMRWEMQHFHWLLALVTARIGLERSIGQHFWRR
jgi:hypothetical protein